MVEVESSHSVDQVMRRWPCTISVFIAHRMRCVGCAVGRHHTVDEACRSHDVDRDVFLGELRRTIERGWPSLQAQPNADIQL